MTEGHISPLRQHISSAVEEETARQGRKYVRGDLAGRQIPQKRGLGGRIVIVVSRGGGGYVHQMALIQFQYRVETGRICHHDPGQGIVHKYVRNKGEGGRGWEWVGGGGWWLRGWEVGWGGKQ